MEGAVFLAGNNLTSLSEQQLMDCVTISNSCEGGSMTSAFLFAVLNGGMCSEASYPYMGVDESPCRSCTTVSKISAWSSVTYDIFSPTDDEYLMAAIQLGPVSVAVEADQDAWQKYTSGVITSSSCGTALDHGVLVVGYDHDSTSGLDYWSLVAATPTAPTLPLTHTHTHTHTTQSTDCSACLSVAAVAYVCDTGS